MNRDQIRALVDALGGLLSVLRQANPADKGEVYQQLGLRLAYDHETQTVLAETRPAPSMCAVVVSEGGLEPKPQPLVIRGDVLLQGGAPNDQLSEHAETDQAIQVASTDEDLDGQLRDRTQNQRIKSPEETVQEDEP